MSGPCNSNWNIEYWNINWNIEYSKKISWSLFCISVQQRMLMYFSGIYFSCLSCGIQLLCLSWLAVTPSGLAHAASVTRSLFFYAYSIWFKQLEICKAERVSVAFMNWHEHNTPPTQPPLLHFIVYHRIIPQKWGSLSPNTSDCSEPYPSEPSPQSSATYSSIYHIESGKHCPWGGDEAPRAKRHRLRCQQILSPNVASLLSCQHPTPHGAHPTHSRDEVSVKDRTWIAWKRFLRKGGLCWLGPLWLEAIDG
jgi:hypothetical protein